LQITFRLTINLEIMLTLMKANNIYLDQEINSRPIFPDWGDVTYLDTAIQRLLNCDWDVSPLFDIIGFKKYQKPDENLAEVSRRPRKVLADHFFPSKCGWSTDDLTKTFALHHLRKVGEFFLPDGRCTGLQPGKIPPPLKRQTQNFFPIEGDEGPIKANNAFWLHDNSPMRNTSRMG